MIALRTITATFEKRLSDGHYGSELASFQLTADLSPDEDVESAGVQLAAKARELTLAQLGVSGSEYVRRTVNPAPLLAPRLSPPDLAELPSAEPADLEELPF